MDKLVFLGVYYMYMSADPELSLIDVVNHPDFSSPESDEEVEQTRIIELPAPLLSFGDEKIADSRRIIKTDYITSAIH